MRGAELLSAPRLCSDKAEARSGETPASWGQRCVRGKGPKRGERRTGLGPRERDEERGKAEGEGAQRAAQERSGSTPGEPCPYELMANGCREWGF